MMDFEVINIGSELLDGTRVNTNLNLLAGLLKDLDCELSRAVVVGDDEERILEVLEDSFSRVELVITTGGLGPTIDDVTKKVVTKFFNRRLVVDTNVLKNLKEYYRKRNIAFSKLVYNQALVPQAARVLSNPKGTAPGLILGKKNRILVVLPGVPEELDYLVANGLIPYLKQKIKFTSKVSRIFKIHGLSEAELSEKIKAVLERREIKFSILPRQIEISLKVGTEGRNAVKLLQEIEDEIRKILGDAVYGIERENLEEIVGLLLKRERKKIAVAESCTGGLIAHRLTNISGSSQYFEEGLVTYSNQSKVKLLGVEEGLLREKGAVSEEVARAMALGIKNRAEVDLGLAVTGIAGPGGAAPGKPAGLMFIALAKADETVVQRFQFRGERELIKLKTSQEALNLLRLNLIKK